ncbi:MAG: hypothetical protein K8W52_32340 [Deltaproteobacteria bacterium]|nr:hypothetical protein [Deltaproteobacteria bacterium]
MRAWLVALIAVASVALVTGCADEVDPPWQLDHDRIIAVRATPPAIGAGETTTLDVLVGHVGEPTTVEMPEAAAIVSPPELAGPLVDGEFTAPTIEELAARGLRADAEVPVVIATRVGPWVATKTVRIGAAAQNPTIAIAIDGAAVEGAIEVAAGVDVALTIDVDAGASVTWLTSCGTLHDFDLAHARLRVEPDDPQAGELAIVVRDAHGGTAWQRWPIVARR